MGSTGDQQYLGRVTCLEPGVMNGYLNNVVVAIQNNRVDNVSDGPSVQPAFTIYLSKAGASGEGGQGWSDDDIIDAKSTGAGGGTVSLSAKRYIKSNEFGSGVAEDIGPIHIWAEATDVPISAAENFEARVTMQAWGYFHQLVSDISS